MVKQRQMNRQSKKRKQRKGFGTGMGYFPRAIGYQGTKIVPLPRQFSLGTQDVYPMRLKGTTSISNTAAGVFTAGYALSPQDTASSSYVGLGNLLPILNSMRGSFTEYMFTRVHVHVMCTSPYTGGGVVGFCYEASDSARNGLPTTLADASGSISAVASPGSPASIEVNCTDYNKQWLTTFSSAADQRSEEAGLIQLYGTNGSAISLAVAVITVEVDVFFTGFRNT